MISVVIPAFNESESLLYFYDELQKVLKKMQVKYEIIFVDDGSTDKTSEILKGFVKIGKNIRVFSFRRNLGKSEALAFGFSKAVGDYIVTLDADLQDSPLDLIHIITKLKEGYDHVSGWRVNRKDTGAKRIFSKLFNSSVSFIFGFKLHDYNCGLKGYTKESAKSLNLYGGLHRFIPLLLHQEGFKVYEIPVSHSKRKYGKSKFGISKVWKDLPDMFTMIFLIKFGKRPLHFFGHVGGIMITVGVLILVYLLIIHFMGETIGRRPLLTFGMLLTLAGIQVLFTGFLADLIINKSYEQNSPALKFSTE
ncbi:MAG: glycosyltransferase family 2 protein [Candidatus Parcubacteria bacterium]|nr:glycosyltransferase family 2 protein [Candidatus Parcubacteria bacterium]